MTAPQTGQAPIIEQPMRDLVAFLKTRLKAGAAFTNPSLTAAANQFFGGTRGGGYFNPREAYDAMEAATHLLLQEDYAADLWRQPVTEALDFLQELAARLPTQSDRTQEQVELQQFSSPIALAYIAAKLLNPQPGELIAEPSAGTGSLAIWAKAAGAQVFCNEIDERRRGILSLLGFDSTDFDAEFIDDFLPGFIKPVGILMNPPFSSTGGRVVKHDTWFGARHVESALKRLEPGGRLVAITSAAMSMKASKFSEWWQKMAKWYNVRANFTVDGKVYAKQGTHASIQIIVIDKDGSTPGETWRDQLENIKWSEAESLEDAWEALKDLCVRQEREDGEDRDEEAQGEMFTPYLVPRLEGAMKHPSPIVEATSMAAIMPPPFTYKMSLPRWMIDKGLLSDVQLESVILAGMQHSRRLVNGARAAFCVGHGTGVGKGRSQPLSAKILTPLGWKTMGEIKVGDLVISADGHPAVVLEVFPQGEIEVYEIEFSDGTRTRASADHLWLTQTRKERYAAKKDPSDKFGEPKIRTTSEIKDSINRIHSIPLMRPAWFKAKPVPIDPYLLGAILGDGCIREHSVQIVVAEHEMQELITAALPPGLLLRHRNRIHFDISAIGRRGRRADKMPAKIKLLGLESKGAAEKFIPEIYKINTPQVRLAVLQGLMDTDGSVDEKGSCVFYSVSKSLADDLEFIVRSLGGITTRSLKRTTGQDCHVIFLRLPIGMSPFRLSRKAARVKEWQKYPPARYIKDIRPIGKDQCQCILISDPSHLYVTDDFIVTHNCLAAIIIDNWLKGRARAAWLSVSRDLREAARRDLEDLGFGDIPLALINDYPASGEIKLKKGVVFLTYATLIAGAKGGQKRIDQLQRWLGKDGVVILDEGHKAKNAFATGQGEPTQTGQAVCDLQDPKRNPEYRVVYSSATGATEVRNLAYMLRLGLWGEGTQFPTFGEFMVEVDGGGVAAMEMICRHLKAAGQYVSGSISFGEDPASGLAVEYNELVHKLTPEQRMMYDNSAKVWQIILQRIDDAIEETNGGSRERSRAISMFWASQQRFFNQVITAFKIPTLVQRIETARSEGRSVIVSLVGTGEARTADKVAKAMAADESLDDLDFSPREIIGDMVERAFPVTLYEDVDDPATGKTVKVVVKDKDGNPVQSRAAVEMRDELIDRISTLHIPDNPLDQIISHFGSRNVAEITGRSRCLVRSKTGKTEYKKRAPDGVSMDKVNLYEMDQFQSGKKRIAIISDAGSMGISLHASYEALNQDRREQIVLQFGWSADKEMQRFGRSHRSNQKYPPIYVLLTTEIGGERRFVSTIARRLGSLGALTKGERRSVDVGDISRYNFETDEGRAALSSMFAAIMRCEEVPGLDDAKQALRDMGLLEELPTGEETIRRENEKNIPRFLNRVLTLEVDRQNAMFDHFFNLFHRTIEISKAQGTFDEGVTDIKAEAIRVAETPRVVAVDAATGAKTVYYKLEVDQATRRVSYEQAMEQVEKRGAAFYFHIKRQEIILAVPSRVHTDVDSGQTYATFSIWKPESLRWDHWRDDELTRKTQLFHPEEAREWWEKQHAEAPAIETTLRHIVGGSIFGVWKRLKTADTKLRVIRATTSAGQRIVGTTIPASHIGTTLRALGISRHLIDPKEIFNAVWKERDRIELVEKILIRQASVHKEKRIEAVSTNYYHFANFRRCNLFNEVIGHQQRFFISTEEEEGVEQIKQLLEVYPPIRPVKGTDTEAVAEDTLFVEKPPVSVYDLLLPVDVPEPKKARPKPTAPPIKEKAPGLFAPRPQGQAKPQARRLAAPTRKIKPKPDRQLAFTFNDADTPEAALDALSAIINEVTAKK